jgi:hypothetical protein
MSYGFYKVLHLTGVMLLFFSLGGMTLQALLGAPAPAEGQRPPGRGLLLAFHGVGMLLLLVAGFGALAKLGVGGVPPWALGKLGIWLALGLAPVLLRRKPELARPLAFALPLLGFLAAALAIHKLGA